MRAWLVFPPAVIEDLAERGLVQRNPERLRWTNRHILSRYGQGVLLRRKSSQVLDGAQFRSLRDSFGAELRTDDPERAARALGLPWQDDMREPGIVAIELGHRP